MSKNTTPGAERVLVDLRELQKMLSCGRTVSEKIAAAADASVKIGRRHLYNVDKIKRYVNECAVNE
jgi:hypothetical protein